MTSVRCGRCRLRPRYISEYVELARDEGCSAEAIARADGTYNRETGLFWCTECYIAIGMPLGVCNATEAAA